MPPSPSLWCPRHLQALRDSHLQAKEAQDRPASTLPTGTRSAKDGHDEGAGLRQQGLSQGHGVEASLGTRGTGADGEVGRCLPKASLLESGGPPRAPRGQKTFCLCGFQK